MSRKRNHILKQTYSPSISNGGDVSQNIQIRLEGYNKNNNFVSVSGEIDIWQAARLVADIKKAVRKFEQSAKEKVTEFKNQLNPDT